MLNAARTISLLLRIPQCHLWPNNSKDAHNVWLFCLATAWTYIMCVMWYACVASFSQFDSKHFSCSDCNSHCEVDFKRYQFFFCEYFFCSRFETLFYCISFVSELGSLSIVPAMVMRDRLRIFNCNDHFFFFLLFLPCCFSFFFIRTFSYAILSKNRLNSLRTSKLCEK